MNKTTKLIIDYCEKRIKKHNDNKRRYVTPGSFFEQCIDARESELQRLSAILYKRNWKDLL